MSTINAAPPAEMFRPTDELKTLVAPHFVQHLSQDVPIPTNEWWGNLLAWDGTRESDAIFASPYTYRMLQGQPGASIGGISVSYLHQYRSDGPMNDNGAIRYYFYPPTIKNLVFSAKELSASNGPAPLRIDGWDDLGVHLTLAPLSGGYMNTYLSLGNAFTTVEYHDLQVVLASDHGWVGVNNQPCHEGQEYPGQVFELSLNNGHKWVLFFFPAAAGSGTVLRFSNNMWTTTSKFTGIVQAAYVSTTAEAFPDDKILAVYRSAAGVYLKGARVIPTMDSAATFSFEWNIASSSVASPEATFLHFALGHLQKMIDPAFAIAKPELLLYSHTRGPMLAYILANSNTKKWVFHVPSPTSNAVEKCTSFYPSHGDISEQDIASLNLCGVVRDEIYGDWAPAIPHEGSYYFKGKALQKFGTMCLVAKKLGESKYPEMLPVARHGIEKLQKLVETFVQNRSAFPLVYDTVYKGIITSEALVKHDMNVDFGNAVYNDHHYHYGYLVTAVAMLLYLDENWSHSPQAVQVRSFVDTLIRDVLNPDNGDKYFPRFRHFNWFLGHSYSHGVTPMADGKDEESTSEEVNFFYGLALYSYMTENKAMVNLAKLMLKVYVLSIDTYFLLTDDNTTHPANFRKNKVTGVFFDNKCDYTTWFSPNKECIHGIQMLPISPIMEAVRSLKFVQEEWDQVLSKLPIVKDWKGNASGWTSLLFANYSRIDRRLACEVLQQCPMDDGLSRAWALYVAATRLPPTC